MASVTREVISPSIAAIQKPPPLLQMNDTADKTDAEADEGDNHEQKQKRVVRNSADEGAYP